LGDLLNCFKNDNKINIRALIAILVCLSIIVGIVVFDFAKNNREYQTTAVAMGTVINVRVFGSEGEAIAHDIKDNISETEKALLSRTEDDSDIYRINEAAGTAVSVSTETVSIISDALEVSKDCDGVFDITIGEITKLWGFGTDDQRLPSDDEINSHLSDVAYSSVELTDTTIRIAEKQSLDLGAVGKGAACDRVRVLLAYSPANSAVVSVGGSLLLYGKRSFNIGIVNPENDQASLASLKLSDTCISTSGNYEKFFTRDGKTYHHILNATTGYPANSALSSVTVICHSGVLSDALSTACYILGYHSSLALLEKYEAEAVFVYKDKTIRLTEGIEKNFTLTDESFTVIK
jgi:thiamine biosynthesis lipoprotein